MEVVVYANTREEEVHAKTVEVVVYANTREKEVNAKTVEVVVYANTRDKEVNAKTVEVEMYEGYLTSLTSLMFYNSSSDDGMLYIYY